MDVKQAVEKAAKEAKFFFPDAYNIQLEEIEMDENKEYWFVTISFKIPEPESEFGGIIPPQKKYKTFKVSAVTEKVESMKIRELK
jgi:hypothetical protein